MGGTVPGLRARRGCKSDNASGNNKRSLGNNQQKMISQEMPPWIYQDLKEGLTSLFLRKTMQFGQNYLTYYFSHLAFPKHFSSMPIARFVRRVLKSHPLTTLKCLKRLVKSVIIVRLPNQGKLWILITIRKLFPKPTLSFCSLICSL